MFNPQSSPGFTPEVESGLFSSVSHEQLYGFDVGETPESIITYGERDILLKLIDICAERAGFGYSASYFARELQRKGIFDDPAKGIEEILRFNMSQHP